MVYSLGEEIVSYFYIVMEEYLTVNELSVRIKFSKHSLYNLIHKGTFVLVKHYLKPTPKKVLFKWSEILAWIGEPLSSEEEITLGYLQIHILEHRMPVVDEGKIFYGDNRVHLPPRSAAGNPPPGSRGGIWGVRRHRGTEAQRHKVKRIISHSQPILSMYPKHATL